MRPTVRAVFVFLLIGCQSEPAADYGRTLFSSTAISTAKSNVFSCSTCHEVSRQASKVLPGYTLFDAVARPSYWGGFATSLLHATNVCLTEFMRSTALNLDEEKGRALFVYLASLSSGGAAPALPLTIVAQIDGQNSLPGGDATRGETLYDNSCKNCHGEPNTGAGRISADANFIPRCTDAADPTDATKTARITTIEKTRHGKFFGLPSRMAPYSLEALSDPQLADILAYLERFGLPKSGETPEWVPDCAVTLAQ
jgi:thiosulfate dehydrogenase